MTAYTLSVVQLCPDAYADAADAIAEAAGYGPGNLSVRLRDAQGGIWRGCHAWWIPEVLATAINPPDEVPGTADILQHVITSVINTGEVLDTDGSVLVAAMTDAEVSEVSQAHWLAALAANGLAVVEPAE